MVSDLHQMYDAVCAGRVEDARLHADEELPDDERTEMEKKWRRGA